MKKFCFIMTVVMLLVCNVQAQSVKFGIKGGLNLPNITAGGANTPVSEGYKSRLAAGIGLFTELKLTQSWSFRFGVEYSGQGGQKNGMQAMPTKRLLTGAASSMGMSMTDEQIAGLTHLTDIMSKYYYADVDNTTKFDYMMIPLLAQYSWHLGQSPWSVYVNAGPFVSFLVSGKLLSDGSSYLYSDASGQTLLWDTFSPTDQTDIAKLFPDMAVTFQDRLDFGTTNITGEMKSANFGITGNIGLCYQWGCNFFFIEAGGNYGFIPVQQDSSNGNNRLGAGSVMLGYAFLFF